MSIRNPNNERSVKQRTESVSGMARKSSSSAKPVRAAAGSVTQGSGKSSSKSANRAGGAPLSKEERKEQKLLREEYLESIRGNLRSQLNKIDIREKDGTIVNLGEKYGNKKGN